MPTQEIGIRKSRALAYELEATLTPSTDELIFEISNTGEQGAAFQLHNLLIPEERPKKYAVEASMKLNDTLYADYQGNYSFSLHGPNGFVRQFQGNLNNSEP